MVKEGAVVRREWPDVLVAGEADPAVLSRAVRRGTLVRLARGVYTGCTTQPPAEVVRAHWVTLLDALLPGAVVVGPAARTLRARADAGESVVPLPDEVATLEVVADRRAVIRLPGLEVRAVRAVAPLRVHETPAGVRVADEGAAGHGTGPGSPAAPVDPAVPRVPVAPTPPVLAEPAAPAAEPAAPTTTGADAARLGTPLPAAPAADRVAGPGLSETAQAVGLALVRHGATTRPRLSVALGLSKPTISAAVAELEQAGLVAPLPTRAGSAGRSAAVFGVAPGAGWSLGIDLGNAQIRLAARGLDGTALAQRGSTLRAAGGVDRLLRDAADAVAETVDRLAGAGPLRSVAIALPKPIRADHRLTGREGPSLGGLAAEEVLGRLSLPAGVPVLAENNVNCAVLAEVEGGVALGRQDVVLVQVGERLGAGIVVGGRLVHGARGGAGEVADVPYPWAPDRPAQELGLEQHLGAGALLRRDAATGPGDAVVADRVTALLARAEAGDPPAVAAVRAHAAEVARLVLALVAVLDPEMVVLGGAIGDHPLVGRWVRAGVAGVAPHTEVVPSALGGAATVEGAAALASRSVLAGLFPSVL